MRKLGKRSDQKMAMLWNQTSEFLWYGKIQTTLERAKCVKSMAEKIITLAMNTYQDTVEVTKTKTNLKGEAVEATYTNDGNKKLAARRQMMAKLRDLQEIKQPKETKTAYKARIKDINHPLIEKIFNDYAPKYSARKDELGQGGGYSRIIKLGQRRGDAAETVILELV